MACDMCGKTGVSLEQLKSEYQTDKISDLCSDCIRLTNKHLWEVRKLSAKFNQNAIQRFMAEFRKHKFNGAGKEDV